MIQLEHVSSEYEKGRPVLEDLSFTIRDGESVGLIGANGAGKTTLMKVVLGLQPFSGKILVDGLPVEERNLSAIRKKLGFVMQNSDNQMFMPTVMEDIVFGPMNYGLSKEEAEKRADGILERLSLTDVKHRYNHKLSAGEKRMAAIAAVLAMDPDTVLMDEPTALLDPFNRRVVIKTVNSLPVTKIITSHDLDMILDTCSRVILLSKGRIVADGEAQAVLKDRALLEMHRMELPLCYSGRNENGRRSVEK